jgi:hypothetical protein
MGLNLGSILGKIVGNSTGNMLESVSNIADKWITTKEEKLEFEQKLQEQLNKHNEFLIQEANKETESYLKDVDSARQRDINANNSEHSSILSKNIAPILALSIIVLTFILIYVIMFKPKLGVEKDIIIYILGALTGYVGMVLSYYFGSSKSSSDKQKQMNDMMNNNSSITIKHPTQ